MFRHKAFRHYVLLIGLCFAILGCDSPKPYLEFVDVPDVMRVGETAQVVLRLSNQGTAMGSSDNGIMDITFVGDPRVRVSIDRSSDRWEKPGVYPPGSKIYHKKTGEMRAKDLLVSPESTGWDANESKKLVLNVTPNKRGTLKVLAGSVFVLKSGGSVNEVRYPDKSDVENQQGHPCLVAEIEVR